MQLSVILQPEICNYERWAKPLIISLAWTGGLRIKTHNIEAITIINIIFVFAMPSLPVILPPSPHYYKLKNFFADQSYQELILSQKQTQQQNCLRFHSGKYFANSSNIVLFFFKTTAFLKQKNRCTKNILVWIQNLFPSCQILDIFIWVTGIARH